MKFVTNPELLKYVNTNFADLVLLNLIRENELYFLITHYIINDNDLIHYLDLLKFINWNSL